MTRSVIIILSFLINGSIFSQDFPSFPIEVIEEGNMLDFAFAGGLNTPQFYNMDINRDGEQDLLIFDRAGGVIVPMININGQYKYESNYVSNFPALRNWIVIKDYNNDGIEDIFCHPTVNSFSAIEVWTGKIENGELAYELKKFDQFSFDILYFILGGNDVNIYVPSSDIPQIVDIDNDGDLDVLSFEPGGSYVWYHRNMVVEEGLSLDTFSFIVEDQCWGKFFENDFSQSVSLSTNSSDCAIPLTEEDFPKDKAVHSGSTLLALDADGDTDYELILGDLASDHLVFLENDEENDVAWMNDIDDNFPNYDVPVKMNFFLSSFYADVNFDGKRDLISSPNAEGASRNDDNVWFYENIGTDESPIFEYRSENLFVGGMIDLGENTHPEFVDINADGLMDLVVGCHGEYNLIDEKDSRLVLYLNTGTQVNPEFTLTDIDYLSMNQYKASINNLSPGFGDLDGDGDLDLVVGDTNGDLVYYENIAGPDVTMSFAPPVFQYMGINPGTHINPQIFDYNGDGLGDLLIGEKNGNNGTEGAGSLNYFENIGSIGNPMFDADITIGNNTSTLGLVNTFDVGQTKPSTDVFAFETEEGVFLFAGSESGQIERYEVDTNDPFAPFTKLDEDYGHFRVGKLSTISLADLDADGTMEMVIGNRRGGLNLFGTDIPSGLVSNSNIAFGNDINLTISPNRTQDIVLIDFETDEVLNLSVVDILGRSVLGSIQLASKQTINLSSLSNGLYLFNISNGSNQVTKRVLKY